MKVKIKDIQPAFNNAHRPMWEKHSEGKILPANSTLPNKWWEIEYNVKIIEKSERDTFGIWRTVWSEAEFPSKEELTMFMLRWS